MPIAFAKTRLPVLHAGTNKATITDGKHFTTAWQLDPKARPDTYYVNVPRRQSVVTFQTDKGKLRFTTRFGQHYDFLVLTQAQDTCHVRISATDEPGVRQAQSTRSAPDTIPFTLKGARAYVTGQLNGAHPVTIQLDLGAGGTVVNKMAADKLALRFDSKTVVTNSQGTNEARGSLGNTLTIGRLHWQNLPITEVGNMNADEDLIIGNYLFREKVIELDYDRKLLIVADKLPQKARSYTAQPVIYEQSRPSFEVTIRHAGQSFAGWFEFDTGRDGTMLLGKDFTRQRDNWTKLQPLMTLPDGRKIVRLDATIGGVEISDIVTNAADPAGPVSRPTLFGNQVLNHFNLLLDNQQGRLYLKPNGRQNEPYADYQRYLRDVQDSRKGDAKQKQ